MEPNKRGKKVSDREGCMEYVKDTTDLIGMEKKATSRKASHAGSWYAEDPGVLRKQLEASLAMAEKKAEGGLVKLLIGPHAGYDFSLKTAAWAYRNLDPTKYKRVILLGPSHHAFLDACAFTRCTKYETPLGPLDIDLETIARLESREGFKPMTLKQDEAEHSLEMHLPLLKLMFHDSPIKLVPLMVGSIDPKKEQQLGQALTEYMRDDESLFVASSDFCHWGMNYDYQYYRKEDGPIYQCIEKLDRRAMAHIEAQDPESLQKYFEETENTVCGRHPIAIALHAIKAAGCAFATKFVHYSQSNQVKHPSEFSVSYAAAYSVKRS